MYRDQLTAAERMKALVNGQGLDRVPVNPCITVHAALISNMYARDYYLNPEMAYEAQSWAKNFTIMMRVLVMLYLNGIVGILVENWNFQIIRKSLYHVSLKDRSHH
jgi:hypothetical protein